MINDWHQRENEEKVQKTEFISLEKGTKNAVIKQPKM